MGLGSIKSTSSNYDKISTDQVKNVKANIDKYYDNNLVATAISAVQDTCADFAESIQEAATNAVDMKNAKEKNVSNVEVMDLDADNNNKTNNQDNKETKIDSTTNPNEYNTQQETKSVTEESKPNNQERSIPALDTQQETTTFNKEEEKKPAPKPVKYSKIYADSFKPQGMCKSGEYTIISAYDDYHSKSSRVYVYDENGNLQKVSELDTSSHVGGICSDGEKLFVTDNKGEVCAYDLKEVTNIMTVPEMHNQNINDIAGSIDSLPRVASGVTVASKTLVGRSSTLCMHDDKLYVGTFDGANPGEMVEFRKDLLTGEYEPGTKYKIPKCTQGIAITEHNGEKYLITTQSYSKANSLITVFKFNSHNNLEVVGYHRDNKPYMEQVTVDGNNVEVVYEGSDKTKTFDLDKMLDNLDKDDSGFNNEVYQSGRNYNRRNNIPIMDQHH